MKRVIRVFNSHEEAERADREYYRSLTPKERVDLCLRLMRCHPESGKFVRVCKVIRLKDKQ